jgi:hypothetical protein
MPRDGYRAVTLPAVVADRLAEAAHISNRSLPKQVEYMLNQLYPSGRRGQGGCSGCTGTRPEFGGVE